MLNRRPNNRRTQETRILLLLTYDRSQLQSSHAGNLYDNTNFKGLENAGVFMLEKLESQDIFPIHPTKVLEGSRKLLIVT